MSLDLDQVFLWCRSFDEYAKIFNLTENDKSKRILGCADGAASFNFEGNQLGWNIISVDPLYFLKAAEIQNRIDLSLDVLYPKICASKDDFIWNYFESPECLRDHRSNVMQTFIQDYKTYPTQRYITGELPSLPFNNKQFDLTLVSCFLFLYSPNLTKNFHLESIQELLRISNEVRVFPLQSNLGGKSEYLQPSIEFVKELGYLATIERVDYEFTRGSNEMLYIRPQE